MIISAVPKEVVDVVWPDVAPVLNKAVVTMRGKFNVGAVREGIEKDELGLWVVMDEGKVVASFTTRVIPYPEGNAMAMDWVGGERMQEWLPLALSTLEDYAKTYGCRHLEGFGRKAWGRVLRSFGWEPEYIAYRKDLSDG